VWQEFFYGLILILATMFMPRGLWGLAETLQAQARPSAKSEPAAGLRQAAPRVRT
jgi:hypothetical protein